jgi:hypothetical protein
MYDAPMNEVKLSKKQITEFVDIFILQLSKNIKQQIINNIKK